ncbi:MAG: Crp/Fnr family transcriptional regulator [Odoribacteraceae bacterium]|jgi:CRP-like cAMP-binding protein|nr:Crp/Fnr family transcriptional regulator [Odoribacteraceae bacterium]
MKEAVSLPDIFQCTGKFKQRFKHLPDDELDILFEGATVKEYGKGELIYMENTRVKGCFLLYSGAVKIFQTGSEGKEQIIRLGKEGDIFGFRSIIREEPTCTSVKTLTDCILCRIPGRSLLQAIALGSAIARAMIQIACQELGEANRYIKDIAQKSVKARLAEILLQIAADFGLEEDGTLTLSMTREDIGNFVGTATETLIRLLSDLKNERIIEAKGRRIRLLNIEKLRTLSE